jgi:hypothetical protein
MARASRAILLASATAAGNLDMYGAVHTVKGGLKVQLGQTNRATGTVFKLDILIGMNDASACNPRKWDLSLKMDSLITTHLSG